MKNFYLRLISTGLLAPIIIFFLYKLNFFFYSLLFFVVILSFIEIFNNVRQKYISLILYLLILLFAYSVLEIRSSNYKGFIECLWVMSIVWASDISGYMVGKLIGGPKLSVYSPNKTISGFLGSIFFSQISIFIPLTFLNNFKFNLSFIFLQFFLSCVSVLGDIFFSYIKRINKIKDYSNIIPGHGGILDRIDGMIFVFIFYFILSLTLDVF